MKQELIKEIHVVNKQIAMLYNKLNAIKEKDMAEHVLICLEKMEFIYEQLEHALHKEKIFGMNDIKIKKLYDILYNIKNNYNK